MSEAFEAFQILQPALTALADTVLVAADAALARVWLAGPGDLCDECVWAGECADRTVCLHLVGSAGVSARLDGPYRRFPLGARAVGRVPVTHEALVQREDLAALEIADPVWLERHAVRSFAALPLEHGVRCIGVLAIFSRGTLPEEDVRLLSAATRLGAEALGNIEAYRRLAAERNRLAAKHARLRAAGGRPAPATDLAPESTLAGTGAMLHADAPAQRASTFAQIQREGIVRALQRARWRVSGPNGAARALGLKPTTLESKMKKLGIRRPPR
ncbi:MAG TPA: GAF domain-containing protein [Terriglobales bacterium]|nr:GAF domain-containing protein [Terriglobales bacterium]